jgi:hypothetical protein
MSESFLYLTTTGHKSGNPHRIEIWYVEGEGCYYLCSELRERAHWVQNILHDPHVTFAVAQRQQPVTEQAAHAQVVHDPQLIGVLAARFDEKYQWSDGLFVAICPRG